MEQKKIVEGIECGDMVTANFTGGYPATAITGRVTCNDAQKCVVDMGGGRNAIIFGNLEPDYARLRDFPGVTVKRV